ncbi:hypothetical protein DPMN_098318 [Dreissena polymorpha]|uniref:Mab-21-like HhH/H2TH-like domain-containing protein n=1 Tax=Dreissena polymorpha TaxID=45954 RepID=A0A9D4R5J2_DREPO|nr:hypothetical protein DPMN_098318 [Dreissena polymorpha]
MKYDTIESLSIKLCTVLEDIGVTEEVIKFRRYVCGLSDFLSTILNHSHGKVHIFGSQVEGSTTLGMHSDTDMLVYKDTWAAYTDLSGCLPSKISFLAIKTTTSCPQCYSLQYVAQLSENTFLPAREGFGCSFKELTSNWDPFMLDEEGRLLLSNRCIGNTWFQKTSQLDPNDKLEQHGPASILNDSQDFVYGMQCPNLPDECRVLFSRSNPGHWPKQDTTKKAEQCGVFFIFPGNIGHTCSYDTERKMVTMNIQYQRNIASRQWRVSTNKIELLLMCDLDIIQIKAYILTKMIRKQFLKPIVCDQLSTYHMKTALLFTVEKYPMEIWNTKTLVHCVLSCLKTLRRFLQERYCPHYSVANVNLFAGKLKISHFPPLIQELTKIINSDLQCVYTLNTDCLGERLKPFQATQTITLISRKKYCSMTMSQLFYVLWRPLHGNFDMTGRKITMQKFRTLMKRLAQNLEHSISYPEDYSFQLEIVYQKIINTIATTDASANIADKKPIANDIHEMYKSSLRSGQISNYLKYASMLVCIHDYDRAVSLLKDIENMITQDMVQVSMISDETVFEPVIARAHKGLTPNEMLKVFQAKIIQNIDFTIFEINCTPRNFIYEMYNRFHTADYQNWIAVVDAKPFLYYLQYLAHEATEGKYAAMAKLSNYCISTKGFRLKGGLGTAYNLMGNILELENMASETWQVYVMSARLQPRNNAAYWHICRLLSQYVADKSHYEMTK